MMLMFIQAPAQRGRCSVKDMGKRPEFNLMTVGPFEARGDDIRSAGIISHSATPGKAT
jgi:hypothetical protein